MNGTLVYDVIHSRMSQLSAGGAGEYMRVPNLRTTDRCRVKSSISLQSRMYSTRIENTKNEFSVYRKYISTKDFPVTSFGPVTDQ